MLLCNFCNQNNADPTSDNNSTPLYIASYADDSTPLYIASYAGFTKIVSLLLKPNANPNLQRISDATPVFITSQKGHTDIVSLLLKADAKPDLLQDESTTALMTAAGEGHSQIIQLLLDNGADPNVQHSSAGATALVFACLSGSLESVKSLLMAGADTSIKGPNGLTAIDVAAQTGYNEIVELLQSITLSQSSTSSGVHPAASYIAGNVDNKAMSLLNQAMELMLVKKTESYITREYQKRERQYFRPNRTRHSQSCDTRN